MPSDGAFGKLIYVPSVLSSDVGEWLNRRCVPRRFGESDSSVCKNINVATVPLRSTLTNNCWERLPITPQLPSSQSQSDVSECAGTPSPLTFPVYERLYSAGVTQRIRLMRAKEERCRNQSASEEASMRRGELLAAVYSHSGNHGLVGLALERKMIATAVRGGIR